MGLSYFTNDKTDSERSGGLSVVTQHVNDRTGRQTLCLLMLFFLFHHPDLTDTHPNGRGMAVGLGASMPVVPLGRFLSN